MDATADLASVGVLARRLEQDISSRGLRPGDRYRTAADAAVLLGVSQATAHRAMRVLVRKRILVRHRGRGTFVGSSAPASASTGAALRTVFVLLPEAQREMYAIPYDAIIQALRARLNAVNVQFAFIPAGNEAEYVRELVRTAQQTGQYVGAIPISCSREVYRCLHDAGGPVVVMGSLYHDQRHLASLDLDYRQSGYLLANYLCERGHKRVALLAAGGGRPGDDAVQDGVSDALTEACRPNNALMVRVFAGDLDVFRAQITELLSTSDAPSGLICGGERVLGVVQSVVEKLGLAKAVEVVFQSHTSPTADHSAYVHVRPKWTLEQLASTVAGMLASLAEGTALDDSRVVVPVELRKES
jgi:GntR family transcriptional regulator of arabinose operon